MLDTVTTATHAGPMPAGSRSAASVDQLFVEAYEAHREVLRRWLCARTRDEDLAEELVHEAFIRLMQELRAGTEIENARAWLFHAARNLLVSHARHAAVAGRYVPESPGFEAASAETVVLALERAEHLQRVLVRLSPTDRELLLATGLGSDGPSLARRAGITQVALRARLCRARRRLREEVALDLGTCLTPTAA